MLTLPHPIMSATTMVKRIHDLSYLGAAEKICTCIIGLLFLVSPLLADSLRLSVWEQASDEDDGLQDEVHCWCKRTIS